MFDVSGKSISNPLAAAAAARTAAAVGTTLSGLNTRAAQMFYQSVEMVTGEVHWTRGELLGEGAYGKASATLPYVCAPFVICQM